MKNCSQCGAPMQDDEVICPVCGQEVQLVPDYETMESRMYEQKKQKEQEEEENRRLEEERLRQEEMEQQAKARKRRRILILVFLAVAAAAIVCFLLLSRAGSGSFEHQMQRAETAYSNSNYEEALDYIQQALALEPDSAEALTLRAQIYDKLGDSEKAAQELEQVIADNPNYEAAYNILIRIYNDLNEPDKIRELLDNCQNAEIKEKYSSYLCEDPVFSLSEGTYDTEQTVEISVSSDADIYYTTDGTEPTENSTRYTEGIQLEEGTTTLRAIAVNAMGIRSSIVEAHYTIRLSVPNQPSIQPASGSYTGSTATKITVTADAGCTIYYSFDTRPTTSSTRYTGPVTMPDGTHTFYAIAVNAAGKISAAASATYVVDRSASGSVIPTPTPTTEPERTPSSGQTVSTPTPTPTPTPTEEPTVTEEPTPTPTEEPETTPPESGSEGGQTEE